MPKVTAVGVPGKPEMLPLALWFGSVGSEPVKSRELEAAGISHPVSSLNNTSLETLFVTSSAISALDTGSLRHFFSQQNYWCFHCHHRLLPTVLLVCPSYCLLNSVICRVICTYLLNRDICNYNTISTVL